MRRWRGSERRVIPPPTFQSRTKALADAEDWDATRRTRLASERTYLAWWRTGLTALTVSIAVGKIVPAVASNGTRWPWVGLSFLYGLLGIALILYAFARQHAMEVAIQRGEYASPSVRVLSALTAFGLLIALGTLTVVAFESWTG